MKAEANTSHPRCEFVRPKGQIQLLDIEIGYGDGPDVLNAVSLTICPGYFVAAVEITGAITPVPGALCRCLKDRRFKARTDSFGRAGHWRPLH